MKKLDMAIGAIELVVAVGVSAIAGSALGLVKPKDLGVIKKVAVWAGGLAISSMAVDKVTDYVDDTCKGAVEQFKGLFKQKEPVEEATEEEA